MKINIQMRFKTLGWITGGGQWGATMSKILTL